MCRRPSITVVICTFNPNRERLEKTLLALHTQSLRSDLFELLLIDNASDPPLQGIAGESNIRVIREMRPGLTFARLRGVIEASSEIILFVDDDNVLNDMYLETVVSAFASSHDLGAIGGRIHPIWEGSPPEDWVSEFFGLLAIRDLGNFPIVARATDPLSYPACAPVGAGMAVRKRSLERWIEIANAGGGSVDRQGSSLSSGGDNDIVLHILKGGWSVGYHPGLTIGHIIPEGRLELPYLERLAESIMTSWVHTLARHGIFPWKPASRWTLPARLLNVYLRQKPWISPAHRIRWRQSRGAILGRASIRRSN